MDAFVRHTGTVAPLDRVAIDGESCRIGAAAAHFDQHGCKQRAEPRLERRSLEVETDNAAHRPELPLVPLTSPAKLGARHRKINEQK